MTISSNHPIGVSKCQQLIFHMISVFFGWGASQMETRRAPTKQNEVYPSEHPVHVFSRHIQIFTYINTSIYHNKCEHRDLKEHTVHNTTTRVKQGSSHAVPTTMVTRRQWRNKSTLITRAQHSKIEHVRSNLSCQLNSQRKYPVWRSSLWR